MSVTKAESRSMWPFDETFDGPGFMRVEELVDGDTAVIRVELPGVDPDKDVDISVSDGRLRIHAKHEERNEEEQEGGYRSEYRYGTFERNLRLPEGTLESDVTAIFKDGVLEVRLPASAEAPPPVKVPVQKG